MGLERGQCHIVDVELARLRKDRLRTIAVGVRIHGDPIATDRNFLLLALKIAFHRSAFIT